MPRFFEITHDSPEYRDTVDFRSRILREPLGLRFSEDEIAAESGHHHLAGSDDDAAGALVACLVLTPVDANHVHLRQMAVHENRRGEGLGRELMDFAESFAREHGYREIVLHARDHAVSFYEKLGYEPLGEPFIEVTIPHQKMRKQLIL